jgi:hypothetical protein
MIITATLALFPLLTPRQVVLSDYADFFSKTSSVYTGIVGVVIGYYFARAEDASKAKQAAAGPK